MATRTSRHSGAGKGSRHSGAGKGSRHSRAVTLLFLLSGFAALTYRVLWVRELGLLFGSTAQAASIAIAIFFAGIASGGW